MSDPLKKTYAQEMKELFLDILIILIIFSVVYGIANLFYGNESTDDYRNPDDEEWNQQYDNFRR